LQFHPSDPHILLSGSTDGLINAYDTRISDEDDVTIQTFNHGASIHHAGFLSDTEVFAISHDERLALYSLAEDFAHGAAMTDFGDIREALGCQYVADVAVKTGGSGAIVGAGSQEYA
jgi:WD repeat-containing protein 89